MNFKYLIIAFILFLLYSCGNQKKEDIVTFLQAWNGKEILLPASSAFTVQGKDTIDFPMSGKFKILTYVDSIGCISCKLQLDQWKVFMDGVNNAGINSVDFLFYFSPEKRRDIISTLKQAGFTYPVCIDEDKELDRLNHFPKTEMDFHTFLLDEDNRVLAIGNPIHNPKVKELYLKIIQGEEVEQEDESKIVKTELDIDKTSISLGNFDWRNEQKTTFIFKNKGSKPLVIEYVNTSCGCTKVSYSQEPVQPGGEITLNVTYKADHPEHFSKTITVYCNTKLSPIKLTISGNAQ